jgi:hypothetical protein
LVAAGGRELSRGCRRPRTRDPHVSGGEREKDWGKMVPSVGLEKEKEKEMVKIQ